MSEDCSHIAVMPARPTWNEGGFTDIVEYTSLRGQDEDGACQLLKKNRQVQKSIIEKHRCKWLKEMGDGVLASFQSVADVVYT